MANFHGTQFDGITFGMQIDKKSEAWKQFKKNFSVNDKAIGIFGDEITVSTIPWFNAAAIMQEAGWLVSESQLISKFVIDGFNDGYEIFINYTYPEQLNFKRRMKDEAIKEVDL